MACFCTVRASFEAALRKGEVVAALAHLEDDPLTTACTHFRNGNTIWHVAASGGHLPLLHALAERITTVWPTSEPPANLQEEQQQQQGSFQRRLNPFQRISDGLRGRTHEAFHLPLAVFVNTPNLLGQTALMTACKRGHAGCVQFLLSMGANPWFRDRANCTALHYATLHDQGACIEALLQHPVSARPPAGARQSLIRLVDLPNCCGYTAVHFAAGANKPRALAALLAGGANMAARCWSEGNDWISGPPGSTPLHLAARRGDMELCKIIMSHYLEILRDNGTPDPRLHIDAKGMRPYQRAAERGCLELAQMLMPSTPLSYIFGLDATRLYKVPKLKALASAALQATLLTQINDREVEAAERRQLAAQAAIAAARTAAIIAFVTGGGGSAGAASGSGAIRPAAAGRVPAGTTDVRSISRASSIVNDAVQFVRRQSLRQLDSLRRRLRGSGNRQGREFSQELRSASHQSNNFDGSSDVAPGGQPVISVYSGGVGAGGTRTISSPCGPYSYTGGTPQLSGLPAALALGTSSPTVSAAGLGGAAVEYGHGVTESLSAASAAAANGVVPLLLASSERSARLKTPAAGAITVDGINQGLITASSMGAAALSMFASVAGRTVASLPGGISPVRGSSFDSGHLPYVTLALSQGQGLGPGGRDTAGAPPPYLVTASAVMPTTVCTDRYAGPDDPNAGGWAQLAPGIRYGGCPTANPTGCNAGGSPIGALSRGIPVQESYRPLALPLPPPPLPQLAQQQHHIVSPFALPALQATFLERCLDTPGGGSPTHSMDGGCTDRCPSGWSPPLPSILSTSGAATGLQTVQEANPVDDISGSGGDERGLERASKRASKYVISSTSQPPLERGRAGLQASDSMVRRLHVGPGVAFAATAAAGLGTTSHGNGEYVPARAVAGSGADPAGGSPRSEAFQVPGAFGCETYSIHGYRRGGSGRASRHGSGRPHASGGSITAGSVAMTAGEVAGVVAATDTIGSDTSEDYCGVCFERPAILYIKPCRHTLCAECSREVTRMVETQPPLCPFCRGIVHGFGC